MAITNTITHRLLTLSRSSLILNRGLNACIIPAFISAGRTAASAAAAKKTAATSTLKTPPKASEKGGVKATATKATSKAKTGAKEPAKPKAAAKKPVKKAAAKKELTDEQKKNLSIRQLRLKALDPPPRIPPNGYAIYFTEHATGKRVPSAEIARDWRALSQDEKDAYFKKAVALKPAVVETYQKWVESKSPLIIREANNARRRLKALGIASGINQIPDDRLPKRISRPNFIYISEQYASGRKFLDADGKNSIVVANKVLREEYDKLPANEKKRFEDLVEKNKKDYDTEMARLEKQWAN